MARSKGEEDVVALSDALFCETFEVLRDGSVREWVDTKQAEDERGSGRSARPRTRASAKQAEEAKA